MSQRKEIVENITEDGGIKKTILKEGSGEVIPIGSKAKVHYRGTLEDGTVFDTSRTRGQPFKFTVGKREVILGWDKGVATMKKGEICKLKCAPDYAYGNRNMGPIPANSTLDFEVELLDWTEPGKGGDDGATAAMVKMVVLLLLLGAVFYFKFNK